MRGRAGAARPERPRPDRGRLPDRERPAFDPGPLTAAGVVELQRLVGNAAVARILDRDPGAAPAGRLGLGRSGRSLLRSPLYDAAERRVKKGESPSKGELEAAIKEFLVELVREQGYRDAGGNPVGPAEMKGVGFIWDADYGAVAGTVMLPSMAAAITDIENGVLKMALRHEMGHYIRSAGGAAPDTFQDGEDVITGINWAALKTQYPQGDMDNWKEEVRADLKGIRLQYRQQRRFPTASQLQAFETMLGGVVDNAHPPAAFRVQTIREFIAETSPAGCCYLTTACVEAMGLPGDCDELRWLRHFRDADLLRRPRGAELVARYYRDAPRIVERIEADPERAAIYDFIYRVVSDCVEAVTRGDMDHAYLTYCEMVIRLRHRFLPDQELPTDA